MKSHKQESTGFIEPKGSYDKDRDVYGLIKHFPQDPFSGGCSVAEFDNEKLSYRKDVYFQANLTTARRLWLDAEDVYLLAFELNFMKSYSPQYRFRGADIKITVKDSIHPNCNLPISTIYPTAIAVDVSKREIQDSSEASLGAGGLPAPAQLSATLKQTHSSKTTFNGRRRFHGLVKDDKTACWRLYEEPGSESGIPPAFRLVVLVPSPETEFYVRLEVSTRMVKWPKVFGLHNLYFDSTFTARSFECKIPYQKDKPFHWYMFYEEVERLFLDKCNWDYLCWKVEQKLSDCKDYQRECREGINRFRKICEGVERLSIEHQEELIKLWKDLAPRVKEFPMPLERSREDIDMVALEKWKADMTSRNECDKFIDAIGESMVACVPGEETSSKNGGLSKREGTAWRKWRPPQADVRAWSASGSSVPT